MLLVVFECLAMLTGFFAIVCSRSAKAAVRLTSLMVFSILSMLRGLAALVVALVASTFVVFSQEFTV